MPRSWAILRPFPSACLLWQRSSTKPRSLKEWGDFLSEVLDEFFLADEETERDMPFIRRVLRDLGEKQELSGFEEKVTPGSDQVPPLLHPWRRRGSGMGF